MTKMRWVDSSRFFRAVVTLVMSLVAGAAFAGPMVQDIEFSSKSGGKFEVRLEFNETPPDFKIYAIEKPARIAVDFLGTSSGLDQKRYSLPYGNANKAVVLESGDRTHQKRVTGRLEIFAALLANHQKEAVAVHTCLIRH